MGIKKTFWLLINTEGYVWDCLEYEYGDYIPVELDYPLPDCIGGRCYKYIDGALVLDEEKYAILKRTPLEEEVKILKEALQAITLSMLRE